MLDKVIKYAFELESLIKEYDDWTRAAIMWATKRDILRMNAPLDLVQSDRSEFNEAIQGLDKRVIESEKFSENAQSKLLSYAKTETTEQARSKFLSVQALLDKYSDLEHDRYQENLQTMFGDSLTPENLLDYAQELIT